MLCPYCQSDVAGFPPSTDGPGLRCTVCKEEGIPILYPREYDQHPAVPVSIFGPGGHGKSVFVDALITQLERRITWPNFSCQWMDTVSMLRVRDRLDAMRKDGVLPDTTEAIFPRPQILRLRNVPRVGGCQLLFYDTSGETFRQAETLRDAGRYLKNSPAIVWLISLNDIEYQEQLGDLMTIYATAMAQMGADPRRQTLILTLTKGDLLVDRPGFPDSARDFLTDDDLDPSTGAWGRLSTISKDLEKWLLESEHRNIVNLLKGQFRQVRFCILSAQGAASDGQQLVMDLMPRGVLSPIFWLWREMKSPVWVETGKTKTVYFSLREALAEAPSGATVRLDGRVYPLEARLELSKPVTLAGVSPEQTILRCSQSGFVAGIKSAGNVTLSGLTLEHTGAEPADVLRVFSGEVTLSQCHIRGGVYQAGASAGDGLFVTDTASVLVARCLVERNEGHGISTRKSARLTVQETKALANGFSGAYISGGAAAIAGSAFDENKQHGIVVTESAKVKLKAILARKNKKHGLLFEKECEVELLSCTVQWNEENGLMAEGSARIKGTKITSAGNRQAGFALAGRTDAELRECIGDQNTRAGIAVEDQAAPVLEGNVCRQNVGFGIVYTGLSAGRCVGNTSSANGGDGLKIAGKATPQLIDNICTENKKFGLNVTETANPVIGKGNLCSGNALGDYQPPKLGKKGWLG